MHRFGRQVLAIEQDIAAISANQPDDHVKSRRFTGAVRSQQADDLATLDLERKALDHLPHFVAFRDVLNAENAH